MNKWLENTKISKKLSFGFITIAAMGLIIGLVGICCMIVLSNNQKTTYSDCTLGIKYSEEAKANFQHMRADIKDLYINYDTDKNTYINQVTTRLSDVQKEVDTYGTTLSDGQDKQNYEALKTTFAAYSKDVNNILDAAKANKPIEDIQKLIAQAKTDSDPADQAFQAVAEYNGTLAANNLKSDQTTSLIIIIVMAVLIVFSAFAALFLSKRISSMIAEPMNMFANLGEALAEGDIDIEAIASKEKMQELLRGDEVGTLAGAFNKIVNGLNNLAEETRTIASGDLTTTISVRSEKDVLGKALEKLVSDFSVLASNIISAAEQVDAGSKQVADSSTALSQGATEQASSIEELSASIAEVSNQVKKNAEDAEKAKALSIRTSDVINGSLGDMDLARQAMDEISSTSNDISKVIKAIDDIAFQTNILALNAAVEAARAGTAGKGFAVVADEVRNLSQKSSEAAKNTTGLIENSVRAVEKGSKLVAKASESFSAVAANSAEVNGLVESISTQAQEESAAISQISIGIEQISAVVQMNSATSEESAAASEELSSQANYMKQNASVFKVKTEY